MTYTALQRESERLQRLRALYAAELRYHPTLLRLHGQIIAQEQRVSELTLAGLEGELRVEREVIAARNAQLAVDRDVEIRAMTQVGGLHPPFDNNEAR